jgi:hypothetical protein
MNLKLSAVIAYLLSWITITGAIWTFFNRVEEVASAESKNSFSEWLKNINAGNLKYWSIHIINAFDAVFGKKHLSIRCFLFSSLASLICVSVIAFGYFSQNPEKIKLVFSNFISIPFLMILFLVLNLIPDYLSLLETRLVLSFIKNAENSMKITLWFLVNLFLTAILIFLTILIISLLFLPFGRLVPFGNGFKFAGQLFLQGLMFSTGTITIFNGPYVGSDFSASNINMNFSNDISLGIFFYSTFLTSAWILLFYLSGVISKVLNRSKSIFVWVINRLDIESKPFKSIGFMFILIVTVFYFVFIFLTILIKFGMILT